MGDTRFDDMELPMTMEQARGRLAELGQKIRTYPHWGAALTAMDEERRELRRFIARREAGAR